MNVAGLNHRFARGDIAYANKKTYRVIGYSLLDENIVVVEDLLGGIEPYDEFLLTPTPPPISVGEIEIDILSKLKYLNARKHPDVERYCVDLLRLIYRNPDWQQPEGEVPEFI